MSDFRAIAGVSSSLRRLLRDQMEDPVDVTIAPPDVSIDSKTGRRLNLYLYQVTENGSMKNQEIQGHGHPGTYGHPPLSLELYYLLTAHGPSETDSDSDLEAQQVLGDAMRVLHDLPIITDQLRITKPTVGTVGDHILDTALLGEFERVKITLQPMTLDDFSKIWTALPQANFRRSVAYQVSVVQIESRQLRRFPRPVGEPPDAGPRVYAIPFSNPYIAEIRVHRPGDPSDMERPFPYASIGDTLIIRGRNFASEATKIFLKGLEIHIKPQANGRIELIVPDDTLPGGTTIPVERRLQPGPQTFEVVTGVAKLSQTGFHSNPAVFMLVPRIDGLTSNLGVTPRTLQISGALLYHENLECLALIGNEVIRSNNYTTARSTTIAFNLPASLGSGAYAVRVRVNGAESIDERILSIP